MDRSRSIRPARPPAAAPTCATRPPAASRRALAAAIKRALGRRRRAGALEHEVEPCRHVDTCPAAAAAPAAPPHRARSGGRRRRDRSRSPRGRAARSSCRRRSRSRTSPRRSAVSHAEVIKELIRNGIFATINQAIDFDTASLVAGELGFETVERGVAERAAAEAAAEPGDRRARDARSEGAGKRVHLHRGRGCGARHPRPDRHDHGPRRPRQDQPAGRDPQARSVAAGEAGGITQHIGAYRGRAQRQAGSPSSTRPATRRSPPCAPAARRSPTSRSSWSPPTTASCPRRREAIDHARAANVPIIVAINKIDKPDANPDRVKQELADLGVLIDEYGGDVDRRAGLAPRRRRHRRPAGDDPARRRPAGPQGQPEPPADRARSSRPRSTKGRGTVATVLVQTGTLHIGDVVTVGRTYGRVRALHERGRQARQDGRAGDRGRDHRPQRPARGRRHPARRAPTRRPPATMAETAEPARDGRRRQDGLHARGHQRPDPGRRRSRSCASSSRPTSRARSGAIRNALERLNTTEVRVNILREGAGDINESDVQLASASEAVVIGFNTKLDPGAQRVGRRARRRRPHVRRHLQADR